MSTRSTSDPTTLTLPENMRAQVLVRHGGYDEALEYRTDYPVPKPGPHQVLIRVSACGVNNTDINTRVGWYAKEITSSTNESNVYNEDDSSKSKKQKVTIGGFDGGIHFPRIQGGDVVGTAAGFGDAVSEENQKYFMGRRIMVDPVERDWDGGDAELMNVDKTKYIGSGYDGGFADYMVAHVKNVYAIDPDSDADDCRTASPLPLSDMELATFAISYTTAENMLFRSSVTEKDTVLITGASGGVGSALIQLAKRRGAKVVAMASASKHEQLRSTLTCLQPTDAIVPRCTDFESLDKVLKDAIGEEYKICVVTDIVGGQDLFPALLQVLQRGVGRYVCSGAIAGPIVPLDLRDLYLKDLTFYGCTIYPPHILETWCDTFATARSNHSCPPRTHCLTW